MKKTSKFLSMILALVMAFALAVPAFADYEWKLLTLEDVNFSVAPIGTATIKGEIYGIQADGMIDICYENVCVFDQDVLVTMKDGRSFVTGDCYGIRFFDGVPSEFFYVQSSYREEDGVFQSWLEKDWDAGMCSYSLYEGETQIKTPYVTTKAFIDYLTANGFEVDFQPAAPAAKPAPGVSVPLNDGTGEFAYTIKSGDSLSKLAAYYYGDMNVYKLIFERNKDILKNANTIYAGQVITLPSYAAVAEFKAPAAPEAPAEPESPAEPAAVKPAPGVSVPLNDGTGEFAYTVKSGDSLSRIAAFYYGDMNVYKLIFERNKDVLKNANTIYAGQAIILPSYAAVAEFQAAAQAPAK